MNLVRSEAINTVIVACWRAFFKAIRIDYYQFNLELFICDFVDFTEANVLECLKSIDERLSAEYTAQVYEKIKPYIHCTVLNNGDIGIKSNEIKLTNRQSLTFTDEQRFAIANKNFNWLINFIFYNRRDSSFNFDPLGGDVPQKFNFNPVQFEKFGLSILEAESQSSLKLRVSKEHLPFLEQQIGFVI